MTTNGLATMTKEQSLGIKEARTQHLLKRWREKTTTKKAFLSSVSLLSLAACGSDSDSYVFKSDLSVSEAVAQFAALRADGYSIKDSAANIDAAIGTSDAVLAGATEIELASADAITVAQSNALAALDNFVGFDGVVTLDAAGDATEISVADLVTKYVLAGDTGQINTINLSATNLDVNVDGAASDDTIIVAGLTVTGTYALGAGSNKVELDDGANISGATITAVGGTYSVELTEDASATMTIAQNALVTTAVGTNTITLSDAGVATARATVENYKLADGANTFNLHADTDSVVGGTGVDVIQTNSLASLSGVSINGGDGNDTLAVTGASSDISGAGLTAIEHITLDTGLNATMTIAQNALVTTAVGINTITLSDAGVATGAAQVETYEIKAASSFTIGAVTQNVTEIPTGQENASSTLVFGTGAYSGTFTDFGPADVLQVVNGTDISGAIDLDTGVLDFQDATATVTLNAAQNGVLTILASGADSGTQTIYVHEEDTFTGDTNIETYEITAGSRFTLGSLTQNATEIGAGGDEDDSTIVFGEGAYSGTFTDFDATDILEVVNGTNLSGTNLTMGTLDFQDAAATVTMSAAQHTDFTFTKLDGNQTVVLTTSGAVASKAGVENYYLSDTGNSTFTQSASPDAVKVVSGARDDLIITASDDDDRDGLTIDLTSGGNDTVRILNDTGLLDPTTGLVTTDFGGFGGNLTNPTTPGTADRYNDASFATTASDWSNLGSPGSTTYIDIHGFTASATDNGRDTVQLANFTGGFVDEVNRTNTDLLGIASGSVFEINSGSFTVNGDQFGNLQSVATMLDSLSNVGDGEYYIIVYNGRDVNADAALYYARATEGDGFDFADSDADTGGYDTDSLELLAVFHEVGSNEFSSLNFETFVA
jgi:hypothetical protein